MLQLTPVSWFFVTHVLISRSLDLEGKAQSGELSPKRSQTYSAAPTPKVVELVSKVATHLLVLSLVLSTLSWVIFPSSATISVSKVAFFQADIFPVVMITLAGLSVIVGNQMNAYCPMIPVSNNHWLKSHLAKWLFYVVWSLIVIVPLDILMPFSTESSGIAISVLFCFFLVISAFFIHSFFVRFVNQAQTDDEKITGLLAENVKKELHSKKLACCAKQVDKIFSALNSGLHFWPNIFALPLFVVWVSARYHAYQPERELLGYTIAAVVVLVLQGITYCVHPKKSALEYAKQTIINS